MTFLDTFLCRKGDDSLDMMVYRKPTHTDRYLHIYSHHLSHVKKGLTRFLHDRVRSVTPSQDKLQEEKG